MNAGKTWMLVVILVLAAGSAAMSTLAWLNSKATKDNLTAVEE